MKLLAVAAIFCTVAFCACSSDSNEELPIVGDWAVSVSDFSVSMEQSPNPENKSLLGGSADCYLSKEDFVAKLQSLFENSSLSFTSSSKFQVDYPSLFSNEIYSFRGTYRFNNGVLEKFYNGISENKTVTKSRLANAEELVIEIASKDEFISAFGYEMPPTICKTTEDLVTSLRVKLVLKRK